MPRSAAASVFAAVILLAAQSAAADPIQTDGLGALMFDYGGLFTSTPTALDSVGVGGRYFLSEDFAMRAAVGMLLDTAKTEVGSASEEASRSQFGIEAGAEFVLTRGRSAYLYTGGLLQISKFEDDPEGGSNNTDRLDITVGGLLGVTYFIVDKLSIGAEYRLGFNYGMQTEERAGDDIETSRTTIGVGTVGFHLGFWFE